MIDVTSTRQRLFTFAVVGDTHVKPESGDQSAPWKVNEKATRRACFIAQEIARYEPAFVIHLGDLVHPVPELPTFDQAVALTKDVFASHHNRLFVLPGNHDIGDKPNRTMPAKGVREDWIEVHERNFGPSWRSFDRDGIRFILINNPVLNSGSERERRQRAWLEETLASAEGLRVFVFMHYPLFVLAPDEPSTYDNIDEPARSDLLQLLHRHKVEAVFAGHVHNVFYNRVDDTEFYVMPATSFVRQDYAEMFRIEAVHENGRDDAEKLGFGLVEVYADGHAVHFVSSHGTELAGQVASVAPRSTDMLPNPKAGRCAPIGVFLRHPWAEVVTLPQNGPMDEFVRKQARNDYPVAALWKLGLSKLRVPIGDLLDPFSRERMRDLVRIGHVFTVSGFGVPVGPVRRCLVENAALVDRFECVLPADEIMGAASELGELRAALGRPVMIARVATSAEEVKLGSKIELFVSHGFRPDQLEDVERLIGGGLRDVDGFVIRAGLGADLVTLSDELDTWSRKNHVKLDLHLRVAASNPAANVVDDAAILAATAELFACAAAHPDITMMLDPFMDIDRGYFVRHGLIDRRCNLRPAAHALHALTAFARPEVLGSRGHVGVRGERSGGGRHLVLSGERRSALILLPAPGMRMEVTPDLLADAGQKRAGLWSLPLDVPWMLSPTIGKSPPEVSTVPLTVDRPYLLVGDRSDG